SSAAGETGKVKKTAWEVVLTATPVILTMLATVLAGLSSSEMTLSQYFRSVAAQNQSKAGDQWGLFQAKRIRGTTLEMEVSLLPGLARPGGYLDPSLLEAAARRLAAKLRQAEKEAEEFLKAGTTNGPSKAAEAFHQAAREKVAQAGKNTQAL